jgi:hypothetical protein
MSLFSLPISQLLCLAFFFKCGLAFAAGPVTHVYLAEQFLEKYGNAYEEEKKNRFLAGTLFPDIRYLGVISREETHLLANSLADILNEPDPFLAGVKFHTFVDMERNRYVVISDVYNKFLTDTSEKLKPTLLKFIEDQTLYSYIDLPRLTNVLSLVYSEALAFGIQEKNLKQWYKLLQLYFKQDPITSLCLLYDLGESLGPYKYEDIQDFYNELLKAQTEPGFIVYVSGLLDYFQLNKK